MPATNCTKTPARKSAHVDSTSPVTTKPITTHTFPSPTTPASNPPSTHSASPPTSPSRISAPPTRPLAEHSSP